MHRMVGKIEQMTTYIKLYPFKSCHRHRHHQNCKNYFQDLTSIKLQQKVFSKYIPSIENNKIINETLWHLL